MAIITQKSGRFACNYWHIRNANYDKQDNTTTLNLGGYADLQDRNEQFPKARDARVVVVTGIHTAASAYAAVLATGGDDWQGATSDV